MLTVAELIERGDATPEQILAALRRQRERRDAIRRKHRDEKCGLSIQGSNPRPEMQAKKKKTRSSDKEITFTSRFNGVHIEVLDHLSGKLGISKNSVMKVALMTLFNHHK